MIKIVFSVFKKRGKNNDLLNGIIIIYRGFTVEILNKKQAKDFIFN
ncbi:hypothetical protein ACI6PS_13220 [Flavobacterium sp. PLA-1-15]